MNDFFQILILSLACSNFKMGLVERAYSPDIRRLKQEDYEFKGQPSPHSKFEASLCYVRLFLNKSKRSGVGM